jgi:mannose-6-phosphate isomerase-like protein (cupin superfamily)
MKLIALFIALAAVTIAADPEDFGLWTGTELKGAGKKLAPKIDQNKVATENLADYGNHLFMVAHREGNGQAELHETQADIIVIESGQGTLVVGGTVVDPKTISPHEVRGASIKDGVTKQLRPGDIVHIAAKTPHQVMVPAGKQITYFVAKVDTP